MVATFKEEYFVSERAKALTQMLVTRREDLALEEIEVDGGLDYLLQIRRQNFYELCQIGIVVKASMTFGTTDQTNERLKSAVERVSKSGSCNFPVALFFFNVKDDRGYFAWIWEPVIDAGLPKLKFQSSPALRELNDNSLDQIIIVAKHWFDAVHTTLTT